MSDNLLVDLTPAEVNIIKQALRAEHSRMAEQGYSQLAKLATETNNKINDALLDSKLIKA